MLKICNGTHLHGRPDCNASSPLADSEAAGTRQGCPPVHDHRKPIESNQTRNDSAAGISLCPRVYEMLRTCQIQLHSCKLVLQQGYSSAPTLRSSANWSNAIAEMKAWGCKLQLTLCLSRFYCDLNIQYINQTISEQPCLMFGPLHSWQMRSRDQLLWAN